mmetsp:Transcript_54719/g.142918  ORF Transcript_54719/g.142918 Transcript_54719/m.142918 type:complete len:261 (+) Transcript_54719:2063-2845(+)
MRLLVTSLSLLPRQPLQEALLRLVGCLLAMGKSGLEGRLTLACLLLLMGEPRLQAVLRHRRLTRLLCELLHQVLLSALGLVRHGLQACLQILLLVASGLLLRGQLSLQMLFAASCDLFFLRHALPQHCFSLLGALLFLGSLHFQLLIGRACSMHIRRQLRLCLACDFFLCRHFLFQLLLLHGSCLLCHGEIRPQALLHVVSSLVVRLHAVLELLLLFVAILLNCRNPLSEVPFHPLSKVFLACQLLLGYCLCLLRGVLLV